MKPDRVKFSVIMPAYNSEEYVREAVDSVLNQTYTNWELIAVNDGSTDSTLSILTQYASADSRIKVFSKENGGYVSAVNYGMDHVTGDYFCFMGSDDQLSAELFSEISAHFTDRIPDMIGFNTVKCSGSQKTADAETFFETYAEMFDTTVCAYAKQYPRHSAILFIRDTAKLYKRSLLGDLRYFGRYGMDADGIFSMLFAHKARSFACVPVEGYYWTIRAASLSGRQMTKEVNADRIQNWIRFFKELEQYPNSEIAPQEIRYLCAFSRLMETYAVQKGSKDLIREGAASGKKYANAFSAELSRSTRVFYAFPETSVLVYRLYCRVKRK